MDDKDGHNHARASRALLASDDTKASGVLYARPINKEEDA